MEHSNFDTKYADLVKEKNFYRLLLSVKSELRKLVKKNIKEFFTLLIWALNILKDNSEGESCLSLFQYAIDEYEKVFNKLDLELCLEFIIKAFNSLPEELDKSKLKHRLLRFFEQKGFSEISLLSHGVYKIFARDSLKNKDTLEGYRYALKSSDLTTILEYVEYFTKNGLQQNSERDFFIARVCLELIHMKNLDLASKFIYNYVDTSNNLQNMQNNHPIINFAFLLTALLCKDASNFDNFWNFINIYKPIITIDFSFTKYLNKISSLYFNRTIIQEESGLNIMNLLRAFSG